MTRQSDVQASLEAMLPCTTEPVGADHVRVHLPLLSLEDAEGLVALVERGWSAPLPDGYHGSDISRPLTDARTVLSTARTMLDYHRYRNYKACDEPAAVEVEHDLRMVVARFERYQRSRARRPDRKSSVTS